MATKVARRTQAERTEATTGALVAAARELFATAGYDATSLDAVASEAGVTKGAVYHHFDGKRQLFEAVFVGEVERMRAPLAHAYGRKKDPWDAFAASCRAFLDESLDPGLQRIMLLDAPAAIGWEQSACSNLRCSKEWRSPSREPSTPAASRRARRRLWPISFSARCAKWR